MRKTKHHIRRLFTLSLYALCTLSFNSATAGEVDSAYFAKLIFEANNRGDFLPDIYRVNPHIGEPTLYAIQKYYVEARLAAGDAIGGFKGGFVPKAPVGGVLFGGDKVLTGEPVLNLKDFGLLVVEAEIGFRFCKAVAAPLDSIERLKQHVCEVMPVVEIADGALADFATVKQNFTHLRNSLIAINVASSHTLVGEAHPVETALDGLPVSMRHNGAAIGERDLAQKIDFWQNLLWIVNSYVLKQGYSLAPGHFIIAGNLTGIHPAKPGSYHADFGSLGSLHFQVQ